MSGYDLYILFLCLIVFTLLTALFSVMLYYIVKMTLKAIRHGLEDERITIEYKQRKSPNPYLNIAGKILTTLFLAFVLAVFGVSIYIQLSGDKVKGDLPIPKIVLSASMSFRHEENGYLTEHNLNDQFDTFDLIFAEKLPGEFDLELYDIVIYEYHGEQIIHRIVGIEEPNEQHPGQRHFLLRGDATKYSDDYPVLYKQMKGIYRGRHIKFIGSFFAFMQSPAGYLCMFLAIFAVFATPIAEKKIWQAKVERLKQIGVIDTDEESKKLMNKTVKSVEV